MMKARAACFDWDQGNIEKIMQRFSLEEVEEFFSQEIFVVEDKNHSSDEPRFIATGLGPRNKSMFVCFTLRSEKIRVVSARYMKANEAKRYEEFKKKHEE
jgi:uncharacterized DUF497 family protein